MSDAMRAGETAAAPAPRSAGEMGPDETDIERFFTWNDYLAYEGPERWEILNGHAYMMAAPSVAHQGISGALFSQFYNWLEGKPCRVFAAPLDVRLFPEEDGSDCTVVQPDLLVVCRDGKAVMDKKAVKGPPDLVVEILSPSNSSEVFLRKFNYYLKAGVREYWILDPEKEMLTIHRYENGRYVSTLHENGGRVPVSVLPGFEVDFARVWAAAGV